MSKRIEKNESKKFEKWPLRTPSGKFPYGVTRMVIMTLSNIIYFILDFFFLFFLFNFYFSFFPPIIYYARQGNRLG